MIKLYEWWQEMYGNKALIAENLKWQNGKNYTQKNHGTKFNLDYEHLVVGGLEHNILTVFISVHLISYFNLFRISFCFFSCFGLQLLILHSVAHRQWLSEISSVCWQKMTEIFDDVVSGQCAPLAQTSSGGSPTQ